jgi:hypothetical protein
VLWLAMPAYSFIMLGLPLVGFWRLALASQRLAIA